jgi:hypothetical protein
MSIEFEYKKTEDQDIETCDSCASEAPLSLFKGNGLDNDSDRNLCELCANSFVGNATRYPKVHDNVPLFQTVAQVGNILLDKLTDRRKALQ